MPYQYSSIEEFKTKIHSWLTNPNPIGIEQTGESYFEFRSKNSRFLFDFSVCFEAPYRMIFGYCLKKNGVLLPTTTPRAWYFSRSESAWRVFTGIVPTSERFLKGLDFFDFSHTAGYAYEAIVDEQIGDALEYFWQVSRPDNSFEIDKISLSASFAENLNLAYLCIALTLDRSFIFQIHQNTGPSLVINNYREETQYENIIPASLIAKSRVTEGKKTLSYLTSISGASSVDVQRSHRTTLTPDEISHLHSEAPIYENLERLQKDKLFWQIIIECLEHPTKIKRTFHSFLKKEVIIHRYVLDVCSVTKITQKFFKTGPDITHKPIEKLAIDISFTKEKIIYEYAQYARQMLPENQVRIETPMCWVSNIFLENSQTTSFGHHDRIPINLSFLVQKPIDYTESVRAEDFKRLGSVRMKQDPHEPNPYIFDNTYADLSLVNEATSPLIRAFKRLHKFKLFRLTHSDDIVLQVDPHATIVASSLSIVEHTDVPQRRDYSQSSSSSSSSSSAPPVTSGIPSVTQSHFIMPPIQVPVALPDPQETPDKKEKFKKPS